MQDVHLCNTCMEPVVQIVQRGCTLVVHDSSRRIFHDRPNLHPAKSTSMEEAINAISERFMVDPEKLNEMVAGLKNPDRISPTVE